jgi:large subunit ribosomal protein L25
MADKIVVKGEKREQFGKNINRRLRGNGMVPVVVYGGGEDVAPIAAPLSELAAVLRTASGVNTVFSLDVAGSAGDVIFQDRQIDPITGRLIHADLRRIAKGEKIELTIPIHLVGEAEGLKEDGAVLSQALREIKVLVEPASAPESIDLDISELASGHSLHVSDLKVGPGVEIHEDPETVVASIVMVKESELEPQLEPGAEPEVAGEAPKEDEGTEG